MLIKLVKEIKIFLVKQKVFLAKLQIFFNSLPHEELTKKVIPTVFRKFSTIFFWVYLQSNSKTAKTTVMLRKNYIINFLVMHN